MLTLWWMREVPVQSRRGLHEYSEVVSRALPTRADIREMHVERTNRHDILHALVFSPRSIRHSLICRNHDRDVCPVTHSDAILEPTVVLGIPQYLGWDFFKGRGFDHFLRERR